MHLSKYLSKNSQQNPIKILVTSYLVLWSRRTPKIITKLFYDLGTFARGQKCCFRRGYLPFFFPFPLITYTKSLAVEIVTESDNVYLLVRHVPFIAKGAKFLLQCTKCSRQAPLYNVQCTGRFWSDFCPL